MVEAFEERVMFVPATRETLPVELFRVNVAPPVPPPAALIVMRLLFWTRVTLDPATRLTAPVEPLREKVPANGRPNCCKGTDNYWTSNQLIRIVSASVTPYTALVTGMVRLSCGNTICPVVLVTSWFPT